MSGRPADERHSPARTLRSDPDTPAEAACVRASESANPAWRPSRYLKFSALVHAGALASALIDPDLWQYGAGAVLASQASLFGAGLWPGGQLLGPNWTRLPRSAALRGEIAITFDDGPDPDVTPAVLDILDQHAAKATFFCIGHRAMACASLCRDIVLRGHAVENHSLRHHYSFACSGYRSFVDDLAAAQDALFDLTGERPRFFRAPFGFRNPLLDPALSRLDLRLASWT